MTLGWRCSSVLLAFCWSVSSVFAQSYSEPGPALNMLEQIQGRWRSQCRPVAEGPGYGYEQTSLTVSFTHFTFVTDIFENSECLVKKTTHASRYRFILREPLMTATGKQAFAIDFQLDNSQDRHFKLHPFNIVGYESGTLRLGEPPVVDSTERLQKLDRELVFSR